MGTRIGELSLVFISYDEPHADDHWLELSTLAPHAKRVDGVKGINSAFRAAADAAETERFLTVDADCVIEPWFLDHFVDDDKLNSRAVICWPARNAVNGLTYGNGGPKCWTRGMLRANEDADSEHYDHVGMFGFLDEPRVMATVHPNGSALHAFRSGYREGVRLSLQGGKPLGLETLAAGLPANTLRRLLIWCMVGADKPFGSWCIYGARRGCIDAQTAALDRTLLADYAVFGDFFEREVENVEPDQAVTDAGEQLRRAGLDVQDLNSDQSIFFRDLFESDVEASRFDMLGQAFLHDDDIPARPDKAFINFFAGALMNSSNAMNNLARCYRDGIGVERNPIEAMNWVLNAAALGNGYALQRLGRTQAEGRGLPRDVAAARTWLARAARAGNSEARSDLAQLLETHEPALDLDSTIEEAGPLDVDAIIAAHHDDGKRGE
ncbi:MAG: tetratricopeptide repeat protein [Pseudomonadota bacterium]